MKQSNTELILTTETFPFSLVAESFIGLEIPHLASAFGKVIIVPTKRPEHVESTRRKLPSNVTVETSFLMEHEQNKTTFVSTSRALLSPHWLKEIRTRPALLSPTSLIRLTNHLSTALAFEKWIIRSLDQGSLDSNSMFYTYWLGPLTLGGALARVRYPTLKLVSRAHRWDLYEEELVPPYLPFIGFELSNLDRLFIVSDNGEKYLSRKYPQYSSKYRVFRLGVPDPGFVTSPSHDGVFRVVSCSYLSPVKRVDLLIQGLREAGRSRPGTQFEWTHIGYGPLMNSLDDLARRILPRNVRFRFLGLVPEGGVLDYYRQNSVDVFVNVSSSEGIPVSIMEAQSCGIPVIATAVGGSPEIVSNEVGILLGKDPPPESIARAMLAIGWEGSALEKRLMARENWRSNFNSEANFPCFAQALLDIANEEPRV